MRQGKCTVCGGKGVSIEMQEGELLELLQMREAIKKINSNFNSY